MKRLLAAFSVSALAVAFSSGCGSGGEVAESSAAANAFRGETSTASGFSTWDSDLVNIDLLASTQTGSGVYVAVLDTGLVPSWRDYFPAARVATHLGTGFDQPVTFGTIDGDPCALGVTVGALTRSTWVGSTGSTHGTHVASTILGYFYQSNFDAAAGLPLPPIMVRGIAPEVTIIPVRVLADYQIPARPNCTDPGPIPAQNAVFGTSEMVAAGIDYVTGLAERGIQPIVINMSLGGPSLDPVEKAAIDRAIAAGVIVVAAAGNEGTTGMSFPGAYPPVISAGAAGWIHEWRFADKAGAPPVAPEARNRLWWLQSGFYPFADVRDATNADDVYVADFSSRALPGQELDVLAPGSWVRGPFPGDPGYNRLPWWSKGIGDLVGGNGSNFFFAGGTSMATPHVAAISALMLQQNGSLEQAQVESILKATALPIPAAGTVVVHDLGTGFETIGWDAGDAENPLDAVGSGLVQADAAVADAGP
jgi:subtilisin family serine protease